MKKQIMLACTFFLLSLTLIISNTNAHAGVWGDQVTNSADLTSQRSILQGQLTGDWSDDFTISWNITEDSGLWTYNYNITDGETIKKTVLELDQGLGLSDISNMIINGSSSSQFSIDTWDSSAPHLGDIPAAIYGIRFEPSGNPVSYSFQTEAAPVWGNFYTVDGSAGKNSRIHAFNNALGYASFDSSDTGEFIVRPGAAGDIMDPGSIAPEPLSSVLFLTGAVALAGRLYRVKKTA
ncbi:MAG: hypothetical protein ISR96_06630 [Nitrospira sp.]|nr:hypothetical protein [bacterium]MBL7049170.1 hypothetical protein [Nitrospira sp.]